MSKKIFISFLTVLFLLSIHVSAYAESDAKEANYIRGRFYMEAFGIDSTEFDYNSSVTRGFAANVVANTMFENLSAIPGDAGFKDVEPDSPYASAVYALSINGIMTGDGGLFSPDNIITYEQAAKVFVAALGRDIEASNMGGFPKGYLDVAVAQDIFDGVEFKTSQTVIFGDFVKMYYNFVHCKGFMLSGHNFDTYYEDDSTVFERKLNRCDMKYIEGVVTGNQFGTVDDDMLGKISIDGITYNLECDIQVDILGFYANAFVKEEHGVVAVIADPEVNNVKTLSPLDIEEFDLNEIKYYEGNSLKTLKLSDVSVARNDKVLSSFKKADLVPLNGELVLIDNNDDEKYEYVSVQSRQYYTVQMISKENNVIVLEDEKYEESTHLYIDPENEMYYHRIYKANGEEAAFSDIQEEDVIRIEGSPDQKILRVYILDEKFDGNINSFFADDDFPLTVNGKKYKIAKNAQQNDLFDATVLNFNAIYTFTVDGSFIVKVDKVKSEAAYAYVIEAYDSPYIDDEVAYKLVSEDKQVYRGLLADKVLYNGKKIPVEKFVPKANVVILYKIDSEGKICSIEDVELHSERSDKIFAKNTGIFYSQTYDYPLFMSDETVVFVVPDSREIDDFMADISLVDGQTYSCESYDYDEENSSVGVIVIYDDVYYESPGYIYAESPVCIFESCMTVIDEDGEFVDQITYYEGEEEKTAFVKNTNNLNRIVDNMAAGDVFQYSVTTRGYIDNIRTLLRPDQNPDYFHIGAYTDIEQVYGKVVDLELKNLPRGYLAKFVNVFTLDVGEEKDKTFLVTSEDKKVSYYLYDSGSHHVKPASFENIMTEDGVLGTFNASEVFIYYYKREAIAVVIKN